MKSTPEKWESRNATGHKSVTFVTARFGNGRRSRLLPSLPPPIACSPEGHYFPYPGRHLVGNPQIFVGPCLPKHLVLPQRNAKRRPPRRLRMTKESMRQVPKAKANRATNVRKVKAKFFRPKTLLRSLQMDNPPIKCYRHISNLRPSCRGPYGLRPGTSVG